MIEGPLQPESPPGLPSEVDDARAIAAELGTLAAGSASTTQQTADALRAHLLEFSERAAAGEDAHGLDIKGESHALVLSALPQLSEAARRLLNSAPSPSAPKAPAPSPVEHQGPVPPPPATALTRTPFQPLQKLLQGAQTGAKAVAALLIAPPLLFSVAIRQLFRKLFPGKDSGPRPNNTPPSTGADPGAELLHRFGLHHLRPLVTLFNWLFRRTIARVRLGENIDREDTTFAAMDHFVLQQDGSLKPLRAWLREVPPQPGGAPSVFAGELYRQRVVPYGRPDSVSSESLLVLSLRVGRPVTALPIPPKLQVIAVEFRAGKQRLAEPLGGTTITECLLGGAELAPPQEADRVEVWCSMREAGPLLPQPSLSLLRQLLPGYARPRTPLQQRYQDELRAQPIQERERHELWLRDATAFRPFLYCAEPAVQAAIQRVSHRTEFTAVSGVGTCLTFAALAADELCALGMPTLVTCGGTINAKTGAIEICPGHAVAVSITDGGLLLADLTELARKVEISRSGERELQKRFWGASPSSPEEIRAFGAELSEWLVRNHTGPPSKFVIDLPSRLPAAAIRGVWRDIIRPCLHDSQTSSAQDFLTCNEVCSGLRRSVPAETSNLPTRQDVLQEIVRDLDGFHRRFPKDQRAATLTAALIDGHVLSDRGTVRDPETLRILVQTPLFRETMAIEVHLFLAAELASMAFNESYSTPEDAREYADHLVLLKELQALLQGPQVTRPLTPRGEAHLHSVARTLANSDRRLPSASGELLRSRCMQESSACIEQLYQRFPRYAASLATMLLQESINSPNLFSSIFRPSASPSPLLLPLRDAASAPVLRALFFDLCKRDILNGMWFLQALHRVDHQGTMEPLSTREVRFLVRRLNREIRRFPQYSGDAPVAALCTRLMLNPCLQQLPQFIQDLRQFKLLADNQLLPAGVDPWSEQRLFRWICRKSVISASPMPIVLDGRKPLPLVELATTWRRAASTLPEFHGILPPSGPPSEREIETLVWRIFRDQPKRERAFVEDVLRRSQQQLARGAGERPSKQDCLRLLLWGAALRALPQKERYFFLLAQRASGERATSPLPQGSPPPSNDSETTTWARALLAGGIPILDDYPEFRSDLARQLGLPLPLAQAVHSPSPDAKGSTLWNFVVAPEDRSSPAWEVLRRQRPSQARRATATAPLREHTLMPGSARPRSRTGEFDSSRPYTPGDAVTHLDWRLFARTDRLHTRQYREAVGRPVVMVVDLEWIAEKLPAWYATGRHARLEEVATRLDALDREERPYRVLYHFRGHPVSLGDNQQLTFAAALEPRWWHLPPRISYDRRRNALFSNIDGKRQRVSNVHANLMAGIAELLAAEQEIGATPFPYLPELAWHETAPLHLPMACELHLYGAPRNLRYLERLCIAARRRHAAIHQWSGPA